MRKIIENPIFTDVTDEGETYTTYRIVRILHLFDRHPAGWTHLAEVVPLRSTGRFEAYLEVVRRVVERSKVRRPLVSED